MDKTITQSNPHPQTKEIARYIEAVGRRKTAIARVRITPAAKGSCSVICQRRWHLESTGHILAM